MASVGRIVPMAGWGVNPNVDCAVGSVNANQECDVLMEWARWNPADLDKQNTVNVPSWFREEDVPMFDVGDVVPINEWGVMPNDATRGVHYANARNSTANMECDDGFWMDPGANSRTKRTPVVEKTRKTIYRKHKKLQYNDRKHVATDPALQIRAAMNNEKRKEKSRNAARSRRSQESTFFNDLSQMLPIPQEQTSQLDKASIMRLAIAFLQSQEVNRLVKKHREASNLDKNETTEDNKIEQMLTDRMYMKALDGFIIAMKSDGTLAFVSENVQDFLGIPYTELVGLTIYEIVHPVECGVLTALLEPKDEEEPASLTVRMKCTLTSKGRTVNFKSASYKNIRLTVHMLLSVPGGVGEDIADDQANARLAKCIVAHCRPIPHPANIEAPLPYGTTFMTKHDSNFKIVQADCQNMSDILGYKEEDLLGKSIYDFVHLNDYPIFTEGAKDLKTLGQCEYDRYRFLAKSGGYVWVTTQATAIPEGKKMQEPPKYSSIVCINHMISGIENPDLILSLSQLESVEPKSVCIPEDRNVTTDDTNNNNNNCKTTPPPPPPLQLPAIVVEKVVETRPPLKEVEPKKLPVPETVTANIFADKTKEMEKPFLSFTDDKSGFTMFKDEPDDLTHLAPVAGEVSVPLDEPIFNGMGLLSTDFDKLLGGDDPTDPFISYRSSYDTSPQLLSPNLSKNSESSLPSLSSPSDSLSDEDRMSTFMSLQLDEDTEPILTKPFILDSAEDMSFLMADSDLMWNSNERSKNSPETPHLRAHLLTTSHINSNNHSKSHDHGGGLLQADQTLKKSYKIEKGTMNKHMSRINKQAPPKRLSHSSFDESPTGKRRKFEQKFEQKEKMSSELLQQLMSMNSNRGLPKGKSNWLLDTGGHKAACVSQPSDSVLMNLLQDDDPMMGLPMKREDDSSDPPSPAEDSTVLDRESMIRKNSLSLLDPDATAIPSSYLTQRDFEVNAPVSNVLYGAELLTALDLNAPL